MIGRGLYVSPKLNACLGRLRLGLSVRKDCVVYWTFDGLPHYLIYKRLGWFLFSLLDISHVDRVPGGFSAVLIHVFNTFFNAEDAERFSFHLTGFRLGPSGRIQRAVFGGILQDYEAFQECFNFKGASGTVCCLKCLKLKSFKVGPYSANVYR